MPRPFLINPNPLFGTSRDRGRATSCLKSGGMSLKMVHAATTAAATAEVAPAPAGMVLVVVFSITTLGIGRSAGRAVQIYGRTSRTCR
jgi:hypothetical protein